MSGRVQRRQAERFAERDAEIVAERQRAVEQQYGANVTAADPLAQLKELAALKADGVLTEQEFAAQKAKILAQ